MSTEASPNRDVGPFGAIAAALKPQLPSELKDFLADCRSLILDYNGDYRKSIFLSATGRGGSTWVSSLMNYDNRYRDMFEPFHSNFVRQSRRFVYTLYLRPTNRDGGYLRQARRVLRGRIRNWWIDHANRRRIVDKRLIKEVRANLWLKWLKVNFPDLPIILLFRHPCGVADSRMILEWPTRLQFFLTQRELMTDHLAPFRDAMIELKTPFERHIMVWCIHYYVPLRQFAPGEIHLAFYENFVAEPRQEIDRLGAFLGEKYDDRVLNLLDKPSGTTSRGSAVRAGERSALADSWRKRITPEQVKRAVEILGWFGLDKIYNEDALPDLSAAIKFSEV